MDWLILLLCVVSSCFGLVLLFGAPYLPTLTKQMNIALDLLDLKPGETMIELGSGDGKVLIAAAKRGWNAVGYELNPILYVLSRMRTWRYRKQVKIVWANFWIAEWPTADAIFSFVLARQMHKLDKTIEQKCHQPVSLASFGAPVPGRAIINHIQGVYLYEYTPKGNATVPRKLCGSN